MNDSRISLFISVPLIRLELKQLARHRLLFWARYAGLAWLCTMLVAALFANNAAFGGLGSTTTLLGESGFFLFIILGLPAIAAIHASDNATGDRLDFLRLCDIDAKRLLFSRFTVLLLFGAITIAGLLPVYAFLSPMDVADTLYRLVCTTVLAAACAAFASTATKSYSSGFAISLGLYGLIALLVPIWVQYLGNDLLVDLVSTSGVTDAFANDWLCYAVDGIAYAACIALLMTFFTFRLARLDHKSVAVHVQRPLRRLINHNYFISPFADMSTLSKLLTFAAAITLVVLAPTTPTVSTAPFILAVLFGIHHARMTTQYELLYVSPLSTNDIAFSTFKSAALALLPILPFVILTTHSSQVLMATFFNNSLGIYQRPLAFTEDIELYWTAGLAIAEGILRYLTLIVLALRATVRSPQLGWQFVGAVISLFWLFLVAILISSVLDALLNPVDILAKIPTRNAPITFGTLGRDTISSLLAMLAVQQVMFLDYVYVLDRDWRSGKHR